MDLQEEAFKNQLIAAVAAGDTKVLANNLRRPPTAVFPLRDDLIHAVLLAAVVRIPFLGELCRSIIRRMTDTLLDDYKSGSRISPLHYAVHGGLLDATKYFVTHLDGRYFITNHSFGGQSMLLFAATTPKRSLQVCAILLEHEADPNQESIHAAVPLLYAVVDNDADAARWLVNVCRANPDHVNSRGYTPLVHAICCNNNAACIRLLVNVCGANPDLESNGSTPLVHAIVRGNTAAIRVLVRECRANPNLVDSDGCTPLVLAVVRNNPVTVRLLVEECGANPCIGKRTVTDRCNCYPIDHAIILGNAQMVSLFLQHGAFLDKYTPLRELLCNRGIDRDTKLEICRNLLLQVITDTSIPRIVSMLDTFQAAIVDLINKGANESLVIILEAGFPPSFRNDQAFHYAIIAKNQEAYHLFIVLYDVDPFLEEDAEDTSQDDYPTVLNYMNSYPTNVHGGGPGPSPFHTAARQDDTCMLEPLLGEWSERFDETNHGENEMGEYPIHAICRDKHVSLAAVEFLLQEGFAEQASVKHHHLYPYQIAALNGASLDVVYALFQHRVGIDTGSVMIEELH